MAASVITGLFLFFCLLQSASADPKKKQPQLIAVHRGDNATLPCEAPNNVTIAAVEWSRPDLSDLDRHIFLKRDGHLVTADQDPSYVNRTQLKDDEMKNGELSLILKNVNNNDEGIYECRYVEDGGGDAQMNLTSTIYLDVKEPPITVEAGDNVTLSCRAPYYVTITAVEWSRSDLKRYVYFQSDGRLDPAEQDPSYVNRVELKDDEMKNGELSLILKNVTSKDGGIYECRYVEKTGRRSKRAAIDGKPISIVQLKVTGGDSESGKYKHQHLGVILTVTLIAALVM